MEWNQVNVEFQLVYFYKTSDLFCQKYWEGEKYFFLLFTFPTWPWFQRKEIPPPWVFCWVGVERWKTKKSDRKINTRKRLPNQEINDLSIANTKILLHSKLNSFLKKICEIYFSHLLAFILKNNFNEAFTTNDIQAELEAWGKLITKQ